MAAKDILGRRGEQLAAAYLQEQGFEVLEQNWRCHAGELDIIAREGQHIVVVEVKTRSSLDYGHPFEALTAQKRSRLYRLAVLWCAARGVREPFRVDAVAVLLPRFGQPSIEHLREVQ